MGYFENYNWAWFSCGFFTMTTYLIFRWKTSHEIKKYDILVALCIFIGGVVSFLMTVFFYFIYWLGKRGNDNVVTPEKISRWKDKYGIKHG